jgi:hypothetical protein
MFKFLSRKKHAFIVYQMGKVGSKTICKSLEKTYGLKNVIHTHEHDVAASYLKKWSSTYEQVFVITGFREPLGRCVSAYFQNLTNEHNHWYVGSQDDVLSKDTDWLINNFLSKLRPHLEERIAPWLSNYERVTNKQFDEFINKEHYWVTSSKNTHFFLYRLEEINEFLTDLSKVPILDKVTFTNENVSAEKWYSPVYKSFKEQFKLTTAEYNSFFDNIDFLHLMYSHPEIKSLSGKFIVNTGQ